jgi:hypothetical protein
MSPARGAARTAWKVLATPTLSNGQNILYGISCPAAMARPCFAVGYSGSNTGVGQPLAERWNGTSWGVLATPTRSAQISYFQGVSCVDAGWCVAVGYSGTNSGVGQPLIELWAKGAWKVMASPTLGPQFNLLNSVFCLSETSCVAVGYAGTGQPLIEDWDGTAWTVMTSPALSAQFNNLDGVTCEPSSTSSGSLPGTCYAVGYTGTFSGVGQPLIELWANGAWKVMGSPTLPNATNLLSSIACTTSRYCFAVGRTGSTSGLSQPLIERLIGTVWSVITSPTTTHPVNTLAGVSCLSATVCFATGFKGTIGQVGEPLVESWDGSTWRQMATPLLTPPDNYLQGISCPVNATVCFAAGYTGSSSGIGQTLVERS